MDEIKFCPKCGTPVEEGARFCRKCGYSFYEESNEQTTDQKTEQPGGHQHRGATIAIGIMCGVLLCFIGIGIGWQMPKGNDDEASDAATVERTEEKEQASVQEAEKSEDVSNSDQGNGRTNTFTATSSDGMFSIKNGTVIYNEDGSAMVTIYEVNSSPYDFSYGWDEGYQMELQLSNGKTLSSSFGTNSILNAGDYRYTIMNFSGIDADIEKIVIYPIYTLTSHGIPENIDNGYKITYTVNKTG